jgi:hypothetical protein
MGDQAVVVTGVLSRDGDEFQTLYEIRRFKVGKPVFCAWCSPQRRALPDGHHDLAGGTLRCRFNDPDDYETEVDIFESFDVVPLEGEPAESFEFHRQGFHVGAVEAHWDYQVGSLFHLVLPPHHLPDPDVATIRPQPTYGWRFDDRFAMGWQGTLINECRLRFRRVAPEAFAAQAARIGRSIRSLPQEARVPSEWVEVDPNPQEPRSMPGGDYDIRAIRDLLTRAFVDERELRRFLRDRREFRAVLHEVGVGTGLSDHVEALIAYCESRVLFEELLVAIREENPRQYERFASRGGVSGAR